MDKSEFALRLIDQGKYYFLSRPRRFGKSLFLDTLKELFEGNQIRRLLCQRLLRLLRLTGAGDHRRGLQQSRPTRHGHARLNQKSVSVCLSYLVHYILLFNKAII